MCNYHLLSYASNSFEMIVLLSQNLSSLVCCRVALKHEIQELENFDKYDKKMLKKSNMGETL